jgi:translocation and assembly module TamA
MRSQHSFSVGTGYSTDQGARVNGTSRNRYLNAAGHKLQSELLWSERERQLLSAYTIPLQDPTREWLVVEGGYLLEDTDTYRSESMLSGVQHIKVLPYNWLFMSALNVNREDYTIAEDEDTTLLVMPELKLSWVTPEKPARMRRGLRVEMRLLASHEAWLSDTNFIQGELLGKYILPVSTKGRLLTRLQAATTLKDDFSELPPSVRLFAGGDTSIRGYAFEAVGETDANGDVIGGSHLLVGSLEFVHLIARKWSLSVFTDAGDAFDETFDVKRSIGMGVRWYSPLGPLRLDLAHPLDSDDAFRVHITLGTDL